MKTIAHINATTGDIQTLETHLSEVGALAAASAGKIGLAEIGELMGVLHDFGKYSADFQQYITLSQINPDEDDYVDQSSKKGKIDHSTAGAQLVWQKFSKFGPAGPLGAQIIALCIASHHSGLINCLDAEGSPAFRIRINKSDEKTHLEECLKAADSALKQQIDKLTSPENFKNFLKTIQVIAALPTSANSKMNTGDSFALGVLVRYLFSCLVDADRINSAEFET